MNSSKVEELNLIHNLDEAKIGTFTFFNRLKSHQDRDEEGLVSHQVKAILEGAGPPELPIS